MRSVLAAILLVGAAIAPAAADAADCRFSGPPQQAATRALDAWARLERERFAVRAPQKPIIKLFDAHCVYVLTPAILGGFSAGGRSFTVRAEARSAKAGGDGSDHLPTQGTAFTLTPDDGVPLTFVIALPELWKFGPTDPRDPEQTFMNVFVHEFSHVHHFPALRAELSRVPKDADSGDVVEKRFEKNPDYVAAYETERDEFLAAARAPDRATARAALARAAALMAARRARWFKDTPDLAAIDDVFLTEEGVGQWSAWTWSTDPRGGALDPATAFRQIRSRRWWQDEGLLVFMALDRVMPDWPRMTMNAPGLTIDGLIRRALQ